MDIFTTKLKICARHKFPLHLSGRVSVQVLMLAGVLSCSDALAQTVVVPRLPRAASAALPTVPSNALPSGNPNATRANLAVGSTAANQVFAPTVVNGQFGDYLIDPNKNIATITENSASGILSWNSFDIGSGSTVNIVQPTKTSVLLNRIEGGVSQTFINGGLNANGIVYFYNPDGIVFGKNAVVNVNSLLATTLNIDNNRFIQGLLAPVNAPNFSVNTNFSGVPGSILVDGDLKPTASGDGGLKNGSYAKLIAANGGKIMLFAPNVTNNGFVTAPDGQVILAAGGKVYLSSPTDVSMRGLKVEVDSSTSNFPTGTTSSVTNNGVIDVAKGNATLVGLAVNQNNLISAQTSVSLNGSIYLKATDGATKTGNTTPASSSTAGTLTLGTGSITKIDIVDDGTTATQGPSDAPFKQSQVRLSGLNILLQGKDTSANGATIAANGGSVDGAKITAHGGRVDILAAQNPSAVLSDLTVADTSSIILNAGSVIDVSGEKNAILPMSSNVISVQLLAEVADNILLRDSPLRGKTLNFDIRKSTNIANIKADLDHIGYTVDQLAATGGTVSVTSIGTIVADTGSKIDVSGGLVTYLPGYVNTSKLIYGGASFNVNTAPANKIYSGFVNQPDGRWDYEPGYFDGKSAGTVSFSAPSMVMQAELLGNTIPGKYQRDVAASNRPLGGQLIIGASPVSLRSDSVVPFQFGYANQLVLNNTATMPAATDPATALASNRMDINVDELSKNGISRLTAFVGGTIDVAGPLSLGAGGNLGLTALGNITFAGGVTLPSGSVSATSVGTVTVKPNSTFNLAGTWRNDIAAAKPSRDADGDPTGDIVNAGGNVSLTGSRVIVGDNVTMDVSGGAWLDGKRHLTAGNGGNISLLATNKYDLSAAQHLVEFGTNLTLESYGLFKGGSLYLQTNNVLVSDVVPLGSGARHSLMYDHETVSPSSPTFATIPDLSQQSLLLSGDFFSNGGFTNFSVTALTAFNLDPGINISPVTKNWVFRNMNSFRTIASGIMADVAVPGQLTLAGPGGGRLPVNVNFGAYSTDPNTGFSGGNLIFGKNATLNLDPGANVTLQAGQSLDFNGTINAPAGNISLELAPPDVRNPYSAQRSIWIDGDAHLFATGSTAMLYDKANGTTTGEVLGGGTINIGGTAGAYNLTDIGYVVVQQQTPESQKVGATFDVSGAVTAKPIVVASSRSRAEPALVASAGGAVNIFSREGILFGGTAKGKAGDASQQGGSFSMLLTNEGKVLSAPDSSQISINIVDGPVNGNLPAGLVAGNNIKNLLDDDLANQAWISTTSFEHGDPKLTGGFDRLAFKSQNAIVLSSATGTMNLDAKSSLYLDAPTLQLATAPNSNSQLTNVQIGSAYVQLGSDDYQFQNNPTANVLANSKNKYYSSSTGNLNNVTTGGPDSKNGPCNSSTTCVNLNVKATTIDLVGNTVVKGADVTKLTAAQDIRLVGVSQLDLSSTQAKSTLQQLMPTGEFSVTGSLSLTATQVYPTTLTTFALNVDGPGSALNFISNGAPGTAPLSAGGTLYGYAQNITQSGTVMAPFGTIDLEASNTLKYVNGSTTSVAGSGTVPFGMVLNGRDWVYDFGQGNEVAFALSPKDDGNLVQTTLPEKTIVSKAPSITTQAGATLDLSGGGKLYAYEFTPGSYGSADVLQNTSNSPTGIFAINPNYTAAVAPRDFQYGQDGGLSPGQSIYLSGIKGLAAGYYTLLPAHYALLPGGLSVTVSKAGRDMVAANNVVNLNGSLSVSGKATVLGAGDSRTLTYVVTPGDIVRRQSQFQEYSLADYFSKAAAAASVNIPMLPVDGGHLEFDASSLLSLKGQFLLAADKNGRNGIADISAPDIVIVSDPAQTVTDPNAVTLVAGDLNAIGADSLMLGGLRQAAGNGTNVTVGAQKVEIANDSTHGLKGPELILVAQNNVTMDSGSAIAASGTLSHAPTDLAIQGTDSSGNVVGTAGALVRVSSGPAVAVTRQSPGNDRGTLTINQGAVVAASGSAYLDATKDNVNNGQLNLSKGAALGLGATSISLGDAIPAGLAGLQFNVSGLSRLSALSSLQLSSYSNIDLYGTVNLGDAKNMKNLILTASGFQGHNNAGSSNSATFAAQNVSLNGGNNFVNCVSSCTSSGSVNIVGQDITIGNGNFIVNGYGNTNLSATGKIQATGTGAFTVDNYLTLAAGNITAASKANVKIAAGNTLVLKSIANPVTEADAQKLGGALHFFSGNTIESSANINTPSGVIDMVATNGVDVSGGVLNTSGTSKTFGSTTAYSPAGSIALNGGTGNVQVDAGAVLDVSAVGASAGMITIEAHADKNGVGYAILNGSLKGNAAPGADNAAQTQGSFVMDVSQLDPGSTFDRLNTQLNNAGFAAARHIRLRNGDLSLSTTLTAHDVILATDNGNINIGGTIDASGAAGGKIQLFASQASAGGNSGNVTLNSGSVLNASAYGATTNTAYSTVGATGTGGTVIIGTGSADGMMQAAVSGGSDIDFVAGAVIDVHGTSTESNGVADGTVTFRAPRVGTAEGQDVAITALAGTIKGSKPATVEAYKVYTATNISSANDVLNSDGTYSNLQAATKTGGVPNSGAMYSEALNFANNDATIINARFSANNPAIVSGIEVRSTGDLTVSVNETGNVLPQNRGWNLNAWHLNNGQVNLDPTTGLPAVDPNTGLPVISLSPVNLTLRAAGNLLVNGSISDGFVKPTGIAKLSLPDWQLDKQTSASLRLVGGANLSAANPNAVNSNQTGDVKISFANTNITKPNDTPVALVRTGTGSIDVAAGRDVVLDSLQTADPTNPVLGAVIYTAGMLSNFDATLPGNNFNAPNNPLNPQYGATVTKTAAQFGEDGGSISITANRDVIGAAQNQLVNNWLFHQGNTALDANGNVAFTRTRGQLNNTAWWSRPDYFDQGIATMGGGNISVVAMGNLQDVSASAATNAFMPGLAPSLLVEHGGGDLFVKAGGDISGGSFYVEKGVGSIAAGGSVTAGNVQSNGSAINTLLALGDAKLNVTAANDLTIETVYNPTLTVQSFYNAAFTASTPSLQIAKNLPQWSNFSTYSNDSAIQLTAIAGDVLLTNNNAGILRMGSGQIPAYVENGNLGGYALLYSMAPANFKTTALSGSVSSAQGFSLAGSPNGQLDILANNSVHLSGLPIVMQDIAQQNFSPYNAPTFLDLSDDGLGGVLDATPKNLGSLPHTSGGLHASDPVPVRIIAQTGDITGSTNGQGIALVLPKKAEIIAGNDIKDLGFTIQNNSASDVTIVKAGHDFVDTTIASIIASPVPHVITGPGRIDLAAGHNVDFGDANGLVTRGNLDNPYMSYGGAAINILAGSTSSDYVSFAKNYVTASDFNKDDQKALITLTGSANAADAWTTFKGLPASAQSAFLNSIEPDMNAIFFGKLVVASKIKGLSQFDSMIATLFPNINPNGGDINIFGSQLKTDQGGSINMFTPSGSVYAGLVNLPTYLVKSSGNGGGKSPSDLGVFTVAGGAIGALVKTNFEVDQGRVFTLGGGDISLVSQYGDLSAGKGAKTASSAPPPLLNTDSFGNTVVDISGSISGSGIATLKTNPDVPDGNIYVVAPRGTFDAGDAGVRSSGSVQINALVVLNAGNIVAAGSLTGVPTVEVSNVGGSVASNATPSTNELTKNITNAGANTGNDKTSLSVDVLGYGPGTDCKDGKDGKDDCGDEKSKKNGKGVSGGTN